MLPSSRTLSDVMRLRASLGPLPPTERHPAFVVLSGLPGTGKSHFCRRLAARLSFVVLESDVLRRVLFSVPTYSAYESSRLFEAIHVLAADLLREGKPVILDATSLAEAERRRLAAIAEGVGARFFIVKMQAPDGVVRKRLDRRSTMPNPHDRSDADWNVYEKLKPKEEPILLRHVIVNTAEDIGPAVGQVVSEILDRKETE